MAMNHVKIVPKGMTGRVHVEVDGTPLSCRKVQVNMAYDEIPRVELEVFATSDIEIEHAQVCFTDETILNEVRNRMGNMKFQDTLRSLMAEFEEEDDTETE